MPRSNLHTAVLRLRIGFVSTFMNLPFPVRILFLEDKPEDVLYLQNALQSAGIPLTSQTVTTEGDLRHTLSAQSWDVVLSDYSLAELRAPQALAIVREADPNLPFILVSAFIDDHIAVAMIRAGAQDYVFKDDLVRLPIAVRREIREAEERRARQRAEASLRTSEERMRLATAAADLGIWSYNVAAHTVFWNEQCYISTGVPLGQRITPEFLESLIHPDDRAARHQALAQALQEGSDAKMEYRIIRPDGGIRWVSSYGRAVLNADGSVKEIHGIATDITDRKLAEEALRINEGRFRGLSASSPVGIFEADLQANVRYTNPRLQAIWHMKEPEILGRGWVARIHPDDRGALVEGWGTASTKGLPFELEYRLLLPNGDIRWIHGRSAIICNNHGEPVATIGTVDDITERRKAEESVRRSEKLAAVGQLASMIAHEINNPLEAVTNLIYLAEMSPELADSIRPLLHDAQQELRRVAHITTQTLQFHRRNAEKTGVAVSGILESALDLFTRRMREQRISLERDYADAPNVICYPSEIRQIFVNLIGNSLDAMLGNPGRLRLRIRGKTNFSQNEKYVHITIADSGIGMDPAVTRRVFDAFFTTKGEKGSGLGLWVTGEILKRHGGSILIRSRRTPQPSGTIISIKLPVNGRSLSQVIPT